MLMWRQMAQQQKRALRGLKKIYGKTPKHSLRGALGLTIF
jgi:hypothetical protein